MTKSVRQRKCMQLIGSGAVLAIAAALVAIPAGARIGGSHPGFGWVDTNPGTPVSVRDVTAAAGQRTGVSAATIRQLTVTGGDSWAVQLLVGSDAASGRYLSIASPIAQSSFVPMDSLEAGDNALIVFSSLGGSTTTTTDRAALVGVAREDVARVAVRLVGGSEQVLPLNRWRSFEYSATTSTAVPTALLAYDGGGGLLQEKPLASSPPGS